MRKITMMISWGTLAVGMVLVGFLGLSTNLIPPRITASVNDQINNSPDAFIAPESTEKSVGAQTLPQLPAVFPGIITKGKRRVFDCKGWRAGQVVASSDMDMSKHLSSFNVMGTKGTMIVAQALPQAKEAFLAAQGDAVRAGYSIHMSSSYRTWQEQASGYCGGQYGGRRTNGRASSRALPGLSSHGRGVAFDVFLFKGDRQLTSARLAGRRNLTRDEETLRDIMQRHNLVSVGPLPHHFELRGTSPASN